MTTAKDNLPRLTLEEYFEWSEKQLEKYEYIDGEVYAIGGELYAMGGGSKSHSRLAVKFTTLFENHLENTRCETGNSDLRVNILDTTNYTFPDVSVTCDERDKNNDKYITHPCLIVEVLSDSTEAYDRGNKFRMYRRNPSLQDYLLVSSTSKEIDLYHKNDAGDWLITNYQAEDNIYLQSINLNFEVKKIYQNIDLTSSS